ncbi:hypothetical protein [Oscillibacter sp.]|uniref:hypothetical protein n=1 Tax=Oscillibacter sp. TaxID=1945593 RepID=UPI0028B24FF7|nr:hypothetical protein [Oscillibacter sp.]
MAKSLSQFSMHICGSLLYTIRPIQEALDLFYARLIARMDEDVAKQRAAVF